MRMTPAAFVASLFLATALATACSSSSAPALGTCCVVQQPANGPLCFCEEPAGTASTFNVTVTGSTCTVTGTGDGGASGTLQGQPPATYADCSAPVGPATGT